MKRTRTFRALGVATLAAVSLSYVGLSWAGDPPASSGNGTTAKSGKSDKFEKPEVEFIKSPNFTEAQRGKGKINYIIIHTTECSTKIAISTFLDQTPGHRVSAHYIVGKNGKIVQMVQDKDQAWHAGVKLYNEEAIGIEHEGKAAENGWTEAQVRASAKLSRWLCHEYGIAVDRKHFLGHQEIAPKRKSDPGPFFQWDLYLKLIGDPRTKADLDAPKKTSTPEPAPAAAPAPKSDDSPPQESTPKPDEKKDDAAKSDAAGDPSKSDGASKPE